LIYLYIVIKYGDSVGNTVAENSSIECAGCYQQGMCWLLSARNVLVAISKDMQAVTLAPT